MRSHLESLGIGRPSTYATIIRSLQERGYCSMVSKTLRPQQRGQLVSARGSSTVPHRPRRPASSTH